MNMHLPNQHLSSRREQVAEIIRESILKGVFKPGERIKELDIAEQLGVSRGPIREALRQLEEEGLIISYPYKGSFVAEISDEEIFDIFIPIRVTLETFAIKKACANPSPDMLQELQEYVTQMIESVNRNDLTGVVENNLLFHKCLVANSGYKSLEQIWNSIMNRIRLHFYKLGMDLNIERSKDAWEHQEILDAIKNKDSRKAVQLLQEHIK